MLKQLKRVTLRMIAGANVATILLMLLVGYSDRLDPSVYPKLSNIGLTFPFFVLVNLLFLAFWLLFKKRWALIPLSGMLLGYQPVRNYCPLNLPQTVPDSTLCVVSFNAYNQRHIDDGEFRSEVLDYLRMQQADIVFLQEFSLRQADRDSLADLYPHIDTTRVVSGGDVLTLLSRYPIVGKEHIPTPADDPTVSAYHSAAFLLNIDGDTVCAINNHLESTRLTEQERSDFKKMLKGDMHKEAARQESQLLIDRLGESTEARAPQARYVARYLERCRSSWPATSTTAPSPTSVAPSARTSPTATARAATDSASAIMPTRSTSASTISCVPTIGFPTNAKLTKKSPFPTIIPCVAG